jgi:pyoverdine/dityrosine biosynthesis protein Dit1
MNTRSTTTDGLQTLTSLSPRDDQQESLQDERALAEAILAVVFDRRRLLPGEADKSVDFAEEAALHLRKILRAIERREPIPLVLPAFPAKSPNRDKTLSHLPDLGDKLALRSLHQMCEQIRAVYEPGAELLICSDGHVFADLVRIPDEHVTEYGQLLREYAREELGEGVSFLDLDDIFEDVDDFDSLREELLIGFGESLRELRLRIKQDPAALAMYRGITRFLFEDFLGLPEFEGMSRRAVQKQARRYAYRVIQRSNAWSRLIAEHHAHALRLSIHPQPRVSEKIGVIMLLSDDVWRTPWHSVAVETEQGFRLMPRHEAEKMSSSLVFVDGRASHYRGAPAAVAA